MTVIMPHVAARMFGEPLMIDAGKLASILYGIGGRVVEGGVVLDGVAPLDHQAFAHGRPSERAGVVGDQLGRFIEAQGAGDRMLFKVDGVGVIPIEGTLVHKGKFLGQSSGETSYEGVQARVGRAMRDPAVKGVVLEVDSYGGEVAGAFQTAKMIAQLSAAKPTLAILTDFAMSAGYLMASAARQIVMPESGAAGSIGALIMHADFTQKLENDGVKVTLISSGAFKTEGQPVVPLSDGARARMQARVDATRGMMADLIGSFRGHRLSAGAALATEAQSYDAGAAVRAGLVDGIIDPQTAFDAFVQRVR